jgi:hypothetical protein
MSVELGTDRWLFLAAVPAAVGGVLVGVGLTGKSGWHAAAFVSGAVLLIAAVGCVFWAGVLWQASRHIGDLACPDPQLHIDTRMRLLRADYGIPGATIDVTAAVAAHVVGGRLRVTVTNAEVAGGEDPAINQGKTLTVEYIRNGFVERETFVEGTTASID